MQQLVKQSMEIFLKKFLVKFPKEHLEDFFIKTAMKNSEEFVEDSLEKS